MELVDLGVKRHEEGQALDVVPVIMAEQHVGADGVRAELCHERFAQHSHAAAAVHDEQTADVGTIHPQGWWIQAAYKLAGLNLDLPYINNLELVGRYDTTRDGISINMDRYTVGYVYYFSNTLLFEGDYEFAHSNTPDQAHNALIFQVSYGF